MERRTKTRETAGRDQVVPVVTHLPPWLKQVLVVLGVTSFGTAATVVVTAANWIQLPGRVQTNTDEIAELRAGQDFVICVARAQVKHVDPAACDGLDPARRGR